MKVLAYPRDPNPYQELLYGEMRRLGARISYVGQLTPSRTLNLLLLPLELAVRRAAGARVIHLHWVFSFSFPGAPRFQVVRWLSYVWFRAWLRTCRMLDLRLVWTAHNVLPHKPVFVDDVSARRALVYTCDLVIAHSQATLDQLGVLGILPCKAAVIQHGPISPQVPASSLRVPGAGGGPRRFLFFGRVLEYKGVEDLLAAFAALPDVVRGGAHLTVAGQCDDPDLKARLNDFARQIGMGVVLRLDRVPGADVAELLGGADMVVLPFRRITTSGSAMLALSHGRPVVVPNLPSLLDLPDGAVLRYDGGIPALVGALVDAVCVDGDALAAMSAAARRFASGVTWQEIAERTTAEVSSVLGIVPHPIDRSGCRELV